MTRLSVLGATGIRDGPDSLQRRGKIELVPLARQRCRHSSADFLLRRGICTQLAAIGSEEAEVARGARDRPSGLVDQGVMVTAEEDEVVDPGRPGAEPGGD